MRSAKQPTPSPIQTGATVLQMTRTNPRQPLWQRVKEEADYKTLGSAHDRQKLSTLADGARWERHLGANHLGHFLLIFFELGFLFQAKALRIRFLSCL